MKRINFRIVLGVLLILGSILGFLQLQGFLANASGIFWGIAFGAAAAFFLYVYFTNKRDWWAAIPGFTLAGISVANLLPGTLGLGSLAFLGGISAGFWAVYFSGHERWWAIIPGGVLLTLGIVSLVPAHFTGLESGAFFMLGIALTFLLVAVLAKMRWAYIPAFVLLIVGLVVNTAFATSVQYLWIIGLFIAGGLKMIFQAFRKK